MIAMFRKSIGEVLSSGLARGYTMVRPSARAKTPRRSAAQNIKASSWANISRREWTLPLFTQYRAPSLICDITAPEMSKTSADPAPAYFNLAQGGHRKP
jgi:hypothetical protein